MQKKSTKGFYVDAEGYPKPQGKTRAEIVEIIYDQSGLEAEKHYTDRRGKPIQGPENAYGVRMSYDDKGRMIRDTSLNERGEPMNNANGNAGMAYTYDADGNPIEGRAFDAEDQPTLMNSGWHAVKLAYDKWGREVERRYYGLSDEPVVETKQHDAHTITSDYDDQGNLKSIKLFDTSGQPVKAEAVFFHFLAHERRGSYDAKNRLESISYFDVDAKPIAGSESWHEMKYEYDDQGFIKAVSTYDQAGIAVMNKEGFCRTEWENDEYGRILKERFYDCAHMLVTNTEGYHLKKNTYDNAGNLVKEAYFDEGERPVSNRTNGVHCIEREFDLFGNCRLEKFMDESGAPVNSRQDFHRVEYRYDRFGSPTATSWFDKDGKPCEGPVGVHRIEKSYDANRGLLMKETRYGASHNPVAGKDGIHEMVYEHNDKQQPTKSQYFGLDQKPAENGYGNHLVEQQYDDRGRQISHTLLRADSTPNWDRDLGIATRTRVYDRENRWVEEAYFDATMHLVTGPNGYAKGSIVYHPDGEEFSNYGPNGKLTLNPLVGFAIKKTSSRQGKNRESYLGPDGELMTGPLGFVDQRGIMTPLE